MLMPRFQLPADAFGDPFEVRTLPLPRPATGYAVQMLGTDTLLDRLSGNFLPVRSSLLKGLFDHFDEAFSAANSWVEGHCETFDEHRLAIVPADFDTVLERHVLIYGVLNEHP